MRFHSSLGHLLPPIGAALLAALMAAPVVLAQGGEPPYFAIRGAKVVPVSGPPLENASVVIARGVIIGVGQDVSIPAEALVIDGKGLTVYPGLMDAFTDVGIPAPPSPSRGETGPAVPSRPSEVARGPEDRPGSTPWRSSADEANLSDKRIESWRSAGFTTVVSAPPGGLFPGQAALLDLGGRRGSDMVVKSPVAVPVSLEAVGNFASFPGSLMGTLAYAHQVWLDTAWSTEAKSRYEKNRRGQSRPRYDRTEAALADALRDHAVVLIPANTTREIRRAFQLPELWKVPGVLYGCQMAYEIPGEIAEKKLPVLVNLKWPQAEKEADPDEKTSLRTLRFRDRAPSAPSALVKAGVKFAFYSGGISAPKDILAAVKKSIDAGLAPDAAVRALTLFPAEIFGVSDRLGSIEPGKIANLVLTDGDLFGEKTKIKIVFVDGQRFDIREPEKPREAPKQGAKPGAPSSASAEVTGGGQ